MWISSELRKLSSGYSFVQVTETCQKNFFSCHTATQRGGGGSQIHLSKVCMHSNIVYPEEPCCWTTLCVRQGLWLKLCGKSLEVGRCILLAAFAWGWTPLSAVSLMWAEMQPGLVQTALPLNNVGVRGATQEPKSISGVIAEDQVLTSLTCSSITLSQWFYLKLCQDLEEYVYVCMCR